MGRAEQSSGSKEGTRRFKFTTRQVPVTHMRVSPPLSIAIAGNIPSDDTKPTEAELPSAIPLITS